MRKNKYSILLLILFISPTIVFCGNNEKIFNGTMVIQKARSILEENDFNKNDERVCEDDASNKSYSLYCALYQSQIEISGKYKHRNMVMKTIRSIVKQKSNGEKFKHPIRDYNNLPEVTKEDILDLLTLASAKLKSKKY